MTTTRELESDEATIESRRVEWFLHDDGHLYAPTTASRQWVVESPPPHDRRFSGVALYQTVAGEWFVHHYHQWDRFCSVTPGLEAAIKATLHYKGQREARAIFGKLFEKGQGPAFTPAEKG